MSQLWVTPEVNKNKEAAAAYVVPNTYLRRELRLLGMLLSGLQPLSPVTVSTVPQV